MSANKEFLTLSKVEILTVPKKKMTIWAPEKTEFKGIKNILTVREIRSDFKCRKCGQPLEKYCTDVLYEYRAQEIVRVTGLACKKCGVLFYPTSKLSELETGLLRVRYMSQYTLNCKPLDKYFIVLEAEAAREEQKKRYEQHQSARICFHVINGNGEAEHFFLVDKEEDVSKNAFLCPNDWHARELLAARFEERKNKIANFGEKKYKIIKVDYNPENRIKGTMGDFLIGDLEIKAGGGYRMHIKNPNTQKIVQALLYSPFTKRYEITQATCEREKSGEIVSVYTDVSLLRKFVDEYGNPGRDNLVFNRANDQKRAGINWDSLADSILTTFGYHVQSKDPISKKERQRILAEVIDLELMPQKKIVNHLDFCIRTHSDIRFVEARNKWEEDKDFVISYKANPERFLIPKSIARKPITNI